MQYHPLDREKTLFLESLPLSVNGKLNRKALPVPDTIRPELEELYVAPRSDMEQLLVKIWVEVLKVEKIGVHDNFFDLGGHSLLATQVTSRLGGAFHVEVPLRVLFEHPTIAGLAVQVAAIQVKTLAQEEMADLLSEVESLSDKEMQKLANKHRLQDAKH
jgi:acyl carrier protein